MVPVSKQNHVLCGPGRGGHNLNSHSQVLFLFRLCQNYAIPFSVAASKTHTAANPSVKHLVRITDKTYRKKGKKKWNTQEKTGSDDLHITFIPLTQGIRGIRCTCVKTTTLCTFMHAEVLLTASLQMGKRNVTPLRLAMQPRPGGKRTAGSSAAGRGAKGGSTQCPGKTGSDETASSQVWETTLNTASAAERGWRPTKSPAAGFLAVVLTPLTGAGLRRIASRVLILAAPSTRPVPVFRPGLGIPSW